MSDPVILPKRFDTLDANDRTCNFRINIDVLNECFGANKTSYRHACYPQGKNQYLLGTKPEEKYLAWLPKLFGNSSEWKNTISHDDNTIYEVAEESRNTDWMEEDKHIIDAKRLVFVKPAPDMPYVFKGVFVNDRMDYLNHSYRRIATKVRLIGNPVTKVELLDHIDYDTGDDNDLESLCRRFDDSISIRDAIKRKADDFTRYVHAKDRRGGVIDFSNPNSVVGVETYKHELFEKSQRLLEISRWEPSWVNTGKIIARLKPLVLDNDNNLINTFYNKSDFINHFDKGSDKYDPHSEQAVYDIYRGDSEPFAFENAAKVFGRKYATLAYLFFLKDDTRFLPISPENFEISFKELNIDIKLQGNCYWEEYIRFIRIIDCIRKMLPSFLDLDHEPTLLEAHSFVWIVGRQEFLSWLKGQEYRKTQEKEEENRRLALEERERKRALKKSLSDFSDEELLAMSSRLIGKEIHNRMKGPAKIMAVSPDLPMSMEIIYIDYDPDKLIHIELTPSAKSNFYFEPEELVGLLSIEPELSNVPIEPVDTADEIVIPESEEEQNEQALQLSTEQLRTIAVKHRVEHPERQEVSIKQYRRYPYIAELAKREANGICQLCGNEAPFVTADGKPFLESHHIVWLSEGGADTIENTVAVCPNCHRKLHYLNSEEDVEFLKSLKQGNT